LYHLSILLVVEWILRHRLSFLSHQELPERLLLTYKTEEAEKGPEPVQIVEEKEKPQSVEEPREKKLLAVLALPLLAKSVSLHVICLLECWYSIAWIYCRI